MKRTATTFILGICAVSRVFAQEDDMRVEKAIPLIREEKTAGPVASYQDGAITATVEPISATSQKSAESITNSLQQQMKLAVIQSMSSWLSLTYGAGLGFKAQEVELLRQENQSSTYLTLLNRPALAYKPREGIEVETAYELQQNLSASLRSGQTNSAILQGKVKITPQTSLGLGMRNENRTAESGDLAEINSAKLTSEMRVKETPVTLQLNPGYESTTTTVSGIEGSQAIRAFVESAVIWKMDATTTFTFGTGFAGGASASSSGYLLVQHVVQPGTAIELRAAMLQAQNEMAGAGYSLSAGSTVALAQALSAGLGLRYKMDENVVIDRPNGETFLSVSLNGKF